MKATTKPYVLWAFLWASAFVAMLCVVFGIALATAALNTQYFWRQMVALGSSFLVVGLILGLTHGLYLRPFRGVWVTWSLCLAMMVVVGFWGYLVPVDQFEGVGLILNIAPFIQLSLVMVANLWLLVLLLRGTAPYAVHLTRTTGAFLVVLFLMIGLLFWGEFGILWRMGEVYGSGSVPPPSLTSPALDASPLSVPAHILPEWYYRPFFTLLFITPSAITGMVLVLAVLLAIAVLPWLCRGHAAPFHRSPRLAWIAPLTICSAFALGLLASVPPSTAMTMLGYAAALLWFCLILIGLPWANRAKPATIRNRAGQT